MIENPQLCEKLPYGNYVLYLWALRPNFTATEDPEDEVGLNLNFGNFIFSSFGTF